MSNYTGFTKLCKGLAVVLIGGHIVVQILPSAVSYLALIPAKTIPFAWNLITSGYIEQSVYGAVISGVGLIFIGKLLEPIWGSREFLKFIFVLHAYFWIQRGPFWALGGHQTDNARSRAIFVEDKSESWIYLRYWQRKPETKLRGDPSDEFAFSTFFPEFLRPIIDPIATIFERILCGKRPETSNESTDYTLGGAPLPGSDPIEASRRRERGARALEERLAAERLDSAGRAGETQKDAAENV